jgi:hypothetical protein
MAAEEGERMYRDEMIQIRALAALEDIIDTCAISTACYKCPFRIYTTEAIMEDHIYRVSDICALYETFGKVPRAIDTGGLLMLFEEGRKKHYEVLHKENGQGSDTGGRAEAPSAAPADNGQRDSEDPESDH